MKTRKIALWIAGVAAFLSIPSPSSACTGISLTTVDGTRVVARTIEWGGTNLHSQYVIVPRGYVQQSWLPDGTTGGLKFKSKYGYVGFAVDQKEFIAEGLNEKGLSAGLFYFPAYGKYPAFEASKASATIVDLQLLAWILGECATVDDVKAAIATVNVTSIDPRASTVHWRFTDDSGRQIVLEYIDGKAVFYDNPLGVLTNSPSFDWQLTNLNNYVNLVPGAAPSQEFGALELRPFGAGSGFLGLPGDITPPSRFVRAAFYQTSAPHYKTTDEAIQEGFQILRNFDIPIGIESAKGVTPTDIPSATQWTAAADMVNRKLYYTTMYNSAIRCFDLKTIDFGKVKYRTALMDPIAPQPVHMITVK
ncbi:choloylglycine hydrolase family protein [uncultured Bacteroides sp.]|uniref:choloylglycine hydrolase family protein n=1 Tax=uncultured Bacteroides sp. TaxID=162156 RepID=UPI00260FF699|nr:choloylglycine hydrolase family protein [uncultured Bacteroides sp.]